MRERGENRKGRGPELVSGPNADPLEGILIRLRTRNARTSFRWVKGHAEDYGDIKADALANTGRESDTPMVIDNDEGWLNNHPALHDGARLQAQTHAEISHKKNYPNTTPSKTE